MSKPYPECVSSEACAELRRADREDYESILTEVRSYVRLQLWLYQEQMAECRAWDMEELLRLRWRTQKALLKLRLAPYVPSWWRERLVTSAQNDFAVFVAQPSMT